MHREDDIIEFNDLDQRRFRALPDWAPIEAIPGIFEDILTAQADAATDIQRLNSNDTQDKNYVESQAELQKAHVRAIQLQAVAKELGELAGAELIDSMLPAAL
jgi:hypothetical protein